MKLTQQISQTAAIFDALSDRVTDLAAERERQGKKLGAEACEALTDLAERAERLRQVAEGDDPEQREAEVAAELEKMREHLGGQNGD